MPALSANSVYDGGLSIHDHSQIANIIASAVVRRSGNDADCWKSHYANMDQDEDKNGGPNHLRAWMRFREINGNQLASLLGGNVTPGMVSELANSRRALSAKWLRRLAPILETTPGLLLDHDPETLDSTIIEVWINATADQRRQLTNVAQAIVRTGTDG